MKTFNPIRSFFLGDRYSGVIRLILLVVLPAITLAWQCYKTVRFHSPFGLGWLVLLYFMGLLSAVATAIYYLKDIYDQDFEKIPLRYLMASFFGWFPPRVHINFREDKSIGRRMVELIGGPAKLIVEPGWVALTETLSMPGKLYGHGMRHFLPRHERLQEVIDLHEQELKLEPVSGFTRDGIQVVVHDAKVSYRIFDGRPDTSNTDKINSRNPYPYSQDAIHNYAYKRSVILNKDKKPEQQSWKFAVALRVNGLISNYINEHKLDEVIAPREQDNKFVREEIRKKAYDPDFIENLRSIGTTLRWWDPGEFRSQNAVEKQYIANWSADVQSEIQVNKAYGEAQKMAYEELGRAEAEAELLMSIIHALDGVRLGKDKVQTLQNLILLRTAQVIKALGTKSPATNSRKNGGS